MKCRVGTATILKGGSTAGSRAEKGFLVACPTCGSGPRDKCDGLNWRRVHRSRVEAYKQRERDRAAKRRAKEAERKVSRM